MFEIANWNFPQKVKNTFLEIFFGLSAIFGCDIDINTKDKKAKYDMRVPNLCINFD